jgi:hypothetical protein
MSPAEQRQRIWHACRAFKAEIVAVLPDRVDHLAAVVKADWAAVRACARIAPAGGE